MPTRRHLVAATAALALLLAACSGGSDNTTEADGTETTSTTVDTSSTTVAGDESTTTTTATSTSAVETTTTTASTTTTDAENEYALALAADGLIVVEKANGSTNMLPFDSAQSIVVNAVTNLLGPPSELNPGNEECGNGQDFVAIWDSELMLEFSQSSFISWSLRPGSSLTDMVGIGWGSSLATLRDNLAVTVEETTLGTEFATSTDGSGYGGLLSDDTENATVDGLWAGPICAFR